MPCIWGTHNRSQLFLRIAVLPPNFHQHLSASGPPNVPVFNALIDTGAQATCITGTVAQTVGLQPLGKRLVTGVSGPASHNYYMFHVGFMVQLGPPGPNNSGFGNLNVFNTPIQGTELATSGLGFDVLLGMDIIGTGSLAVEGSGTFSFSF